MVVREVLTLIRVMANSFYNFARGNPLIRDFFFSLPLGFRLKMFRLFSFFATEKSAIPQGADKQALNLEKFSTKYLKIVQRVPDDFTGAFPPNSHRKYALLGHESTHLQNGQTQHDFFGSSLANIVTVDFWDTLVFRTRPPESSKKLSSFRMSFFEWRENDFRFTRRSTEEIYENRIAIESEDFVENGETSIYRVYERLLKHSPLHSRKNELLQLEKLDEIKFSLINQSLESWLETNQQAAKYVVSDFYMSSIDLEEIYLKIGGKVHFVDFFSSSDYGETKRNEGKLFERIDRSGNAKWLHVGDNLHSDVVMAKKKGGKSHHVKTYANRFNNDKPLENYSNLIRSLETSSLTGIDKYLIEVSIIAYSLVTSAIEVALAQGKKQLVFLSREGSTLRKSHSLLSKFLAQELDVEISSKHLPISRTSSLMCSFADSPDCGFHYISDQYPKINSKALIDTLGLQDKLAQMVRLSLGSFQYYETSRVWSKLDKTLREEIYNYLQEQKRLLKYLCVKNEITPSSSLLCDLGWRGTMQDSLSRIYQESFDGVYLGVFSAFPSQNSHSYSGNKIGLLWDEKSGTHPPTQFTFPGPLERGFTIDPSQVIRYKTDNNGDTTLVRGNSESNQSFINRVSYFDAYYPVVFKIVSKTLFSFGSFGLESSNICLEALQSWYLSPSGQQSDLWFFENHSEGFGAGDSVHYKNDFPQPNWVGKNLRDSLFSSATASRWFEGYMNTTAVKEFLELNRSANATS